LLNILANRDAKSFDTGSDPKAAIYSQRKKG
jgi:hypothetical protein